MDGTFFEFETTLPPGVDDDPGNVLEEEEEEYDALNDETFGAAANEDWEENHEALARLAEDSRQQEGFNDVNHNQNSSIDHDDLKNGRELEASLTQLVLEDSDEIAVKNKSSRSQLTQSNLSPYPETPNPLRNSVWAVGKHDVPPPISTSSPIGPRTPLPPGVKNVCTVEELERNLLQARSGEIANSPLSSSTVGNLGSGVPLRLEDVERKLTQTLPQPRLNIAPDITTRPPPGLGRSSILLNLLQNQRLIGPSGSLEPPKVPLQQIPLGYNNSNLNPHLSLQQHTFQPIHPGPGVLQMGPHQQQQPPHLPFNANGPRMPPFHMNPQLMPPQTLQHHIHQHMQHLQQLRSGGNNAFQHQHPHHLFPGQHHQSSNVPNSQYFHQHHHHRVNGAGDFDEYAGLMTPWQKQWLLNIQTLQLNVGVPYLVDYYFTVYNSRQHTRNLSEKSITFSDRAVTRPESAKLGRDHPEATKPGRERPPSVMGPAKAYTPLQFENSLGKLQCVSVSAPRKLIDMEVMSSEGSESQSIQRDIKKTKQLLLEIERLYALLLDLEDSFNPLAIQAAAEAAAIINDSSIDEVPSEKASPEEIVQRMVSVLLQGDKILGFMGIRKGKTFFLRLLPHVPLDVGLHTAFWAQVLHGLSNVVRRDQTDGLLSRFLPELNRWLDVCELPQLLKITTSLVVEASPKPKSPKSALATAVSSKFGVLALTTILTTVGKHLNSLSEDQKRQWLDFMSTLANIAETSKILDVNSTQCAPPDFLATLQSHLDLCGTMLTAHQVDLLKQLFMASCTTNSKNETKTESVTAHDKIVGQGTRLNFMPLLSKERN